MNFVPDQLEIIFCIKNVGKEIQKWIRQMKLQKLRCSGA